jgi:hypothetical protein
MDPSLATEDVVTESSTTSTTTTTEKETNTEEDTVEKYFTFTYLEQFSSVVAFLLGLLINSGSINVLGFILGINHKFFTVRESYQKIGSELQTVVPAYVLGVFLVNINLVYFVFSVMMGYWTTHYNCNVSSALTCLKRKVPSHISKNLELTLKGKTGFFYDFLRTNSFSVSKEE